MYIERPRELFQPCVITKLDDHEGLIVSINHERCGSMILVRYYMYGQIRHDWFYDFEIELKRPKEHKYDFFRG